MMDIPNALLYRPNMEHYHSSVIACFCMSDGWNEQTLLKLKERTGASFLVGIQTIASKAEYPSIVEGIVRCQHEDIQQVIKLLDISPRGLIGIDVIDIQDLFKRAYEYNFIYSCITDPSSLDREKISVHNLINQLSDNISVKGFLVGMESSESISLDTTTYVIEALESCIIADDLDKYYCTSMTSDPDSFCLRMIYAKDH